MKHTNRLTTPFLLLLLPLLAYGQESQDKFFDSNGVLIRYIEQGKGEPVVLVHGFGSSIELNWVTPGVVNRLASNYRVIAMDCRGFGKSDKPHGKDKYGPEMSLDIVRLLDHLKIQKAHIVGYSMGSVITAKLLTMKPGRFLTATLGGSPGRLAWLPEENAASHEKWADEYEKGNFRSLIRATWPTDLPPPTEEDFRKREASYAGKDLVALASVRRSYPDQVVTAKQMRSIKIPTISIIGTADHLLESVRELKKEMPQLKIVTIEGATHSGDRGAVRRPEFVQVLQDFLKAHSIKK
jgi:pimeloyl-ACP methyl ester carboxylesterase